MSHIEGDQAAGGIEDIDGRRLGRVGMADLRREDDGDAEVAAEGKHPGGMPEARRGPLRTTVAHGLQGQGAGRQDRAPSLQRLVCRRAPLGQDRPAHVGVGSEQDLSLIHI